MTAIARSCALAGDDLLHVHHSLGTMRRVSCASAYSPALPFQQAREAVAYVTDEVKKPAVFREGGLHGEWASETEPVTSTTNDTIGTSSVDRFS